MIYGLLRLLLGVLGPWRFSGPEVLAGITPGLLLGSRALAAPKPRGLGKNHLNSAKPSVILKNLDSFTSSSQLVCTRSHGRCQLPWPESHHGAEHRAGTIGG